MDSRFAISPIMGTPGGLPIDTEQIKFYPPSAIAFFAGYLLQAAIGRISVARRLNLVGALLVGYDTSPNKNRNWLHIVVLAAVMSLAVCVIVDLEFPRFALIRVDAADQVLIGLPKSIA